MRKTTYFYDYIKNKKTYLFFSEFEMNFSKGNNTTKSYNN